MLRIYYKRDRRLAKESDLEALREIPMDQIIWVDLQNPTLQEKITIETYFDIKYSSEEESQEIEMSSRFSEVEDELIINTNFLSLRERGFDYCPVSVILEKNMLFTYRDDDLKSFGETVKKIKASALSYSNGYQILLSLLETAIDNDADIIEKLAKNIAALSQQMVLRKKGSDEEILIQISSFQNETMLLRENIIDKQRLISSLMKSNSFPDEYKAVLRIMIRDISSILEHNKFAFERLEYLQDTFMGFVNIEQNRIIKIFTVATVAFMPPTLIASVYGMNFRSMPELDWEAGYGFAIALMVLSSALTLLYFKKKNWL